MSQSPSDQPPDVVGDPDRLDALRRLKALDTPPDEGLDALADLARTLLDVPVALVTLVDSGRQFFKSGLGLAEPWSTRRETPLSHSFCRYAVAEDEYLAIEDAREHPVLADNPAIEDLGVVAYLGIPLHTHEGQAVGTLCAIDHEPRAWTEDDVVLLSVLADAVIRRLELQARLEELDEARRSVEHRETYYRSLIEGGMDAVTVLDSEGRILYTSPNSMELLGRTPEERAGRLAFDWVHEEDLPAVREEFVKILGEPGGTARAEFRYDHPERGWLRIEGIGKNLLHEPVVGGIVFNFRDMTRERELEEELRQRQKLETIGELTAGIAHDFNNLLSVVSANAELLKDGLRPGADEAHRDLEDLRAAARGGAELIRSLMTFSRQSRPSLRPTDLGTVVGQAGRMLRRILPSAVHMEWVVPPDLPPVRADARALEQILLNLATNARDAMPDGGRLTLRLVREEDPSTFVRLEVEDTGHGMDEETLARAREPFFTTKGIGQGTGLGLAMIQRLVEQHGGAIEIRSEVGRGTRVVVRLPVATEPVAPTEPGRAEGAGAAGAAAGGLVLVVEDEEALRRTAQRVLERVGYRVLAAPDGRAGWEVFQERSEDVALVFADQDMPRMSGVELLEEVRASGSAVPFVLSTGYTLREFGTEDLLEGLSFLAKPWTIEDLAATVRGALQRVEG